MCMKRVYQRCFDSLFEYLVAFTHSDMLAGADRYLTHCTSLSVLQSRVDINYFQGPTDDSVIE